MLQLIFLILGTLILLSAIPFLGLAVFSGHATLGFIGAIGLIVGAIRLFSLSDSL